MNMRPILAVVVLLLPLSGQAQTGFYGGLGLGYVDLGQDEGDIAAAARVSGVTGTVTELDDSGLAWKLFGGYEFNDFFSSEIGYTDLGDARASFVATAPTAAVINAEAEASAFTAFIVGTYLFNRELGVFGRLDAAYWSVDGTAAATVGGTTVTASADDDGIDFLFGLGAQYNFSEQVGLRLEWEHYSGVGDTSAGTDSSANVFGGSLLYRF